MSDVTKAAFRLTNFKIPNFSYNQSQHKNPEIALEFDARGICEKEKSDYQLFLEVKGIENKDVVIFEAKIVGSFSFRESIDEKGIPDFFYANAIAILFPYLRSFISTLTLQANSGLIILDTLNLTKMKDSLVLNTVYK